MTELLTAAQMQAIEKAAIDSGDVTGLELMERAGQGVVEAIFEEWPELVDPAGGPAPQTPRGISEQKKRRAVVLCGPGNNGGDGFVVARLMKERGWEVEVFLYGDPSKLPPDARVNYERWCGGGGNVVHFASFNPWASHADVFMDAVFGTGLSRLVEKDIAKKLGEAAVIERFVAIDIPSGLCADSGKNLIDRDVETGASFASPASHLTVTFQYQKHGHRIGVCATSCGVVRTVDIGLDHKQAMRLLGRPYDPVSRRRADFSAIVSLFDNRTLLRGFSTLESYLDKAWSGKNGNKFTHGHALILSGGPGKTGAARLAARGALRIGAGLVTLGVPPSAQMEVASQITSLMLRRVEGGEGLAELLSDERLNALCLGPGLGMDRARDLVPVALQHTRATVLDADALSGFADAPDELFGMLHETCVLTPHGGEFARLFPDISEKLNAVPTKGPAYSKVDATREAAKRAGCVVLFKGPDTVIANPDGRCSVNSAHYERAAPWLATAGSGDVLAGFITGLLARGFDPMQAAETGAWLHVECARHFGPGLIAEDLPEQLPAVFRELGI
ncbi:NAD(P)H-hydrate dehydratase [Ruegeria sp. 2012CJ41-6]|uniref:Bifunctional NAD(P)H-hydrate repair enzyme n=1 Tax=Ruegeria spongiae TaxID=2942209 RepID=A0ABT0Q5D3_9RHOB|nr:NAD(P)H-hydrate dehydratase [Ruegeria spongiae]MCL6285069.1 NAD(P)H-hydrate dehydratase [Ruegeria spongiae]